MFLFRVFYLDNFQDVVVAAAAVLVLSDILATFLYARVASYSTAAELAEIHGQRQCRASPRSLACYKQRRRRARPVCRLVDVVCGVCVCGRRKKEREYKRRNRVYDVM